MNTTNQKQRVLFTGSVGESLPPPYAGVPKLTLLVARKWREMGHSVGITWMEDRKNADDLGAGGTYFFEYHTPPNKLKRIWFLIRYFLRNPYLYFFLLTSHIRLARKISKESILYSAYGVYLDTVFVSFRPTVVVAEAALIRSFMAAMIAERRNVPIVFDTYSEVHNNTISHISPEIEALYWKTFLNKAELIIAPSNYCGAAPKKYVVDGKCVVLYPGIDIELFVDAKNVSKTDARTQFQLPQDLFLIGAVGAFTYRKGHDHLIKAAAILARKNIPVGVVLCGPGSQDEWKTLARTEGIAEKVFFFTGLSEKDLLVLYRTMDVYCDASNTPRACLGMSLTEAMLVNIPAIAYNTGGLPEVVHEGENGALVPLNDIPGLAEKIEYMKNLPQEERDRMGKKGREMCEKLLDLGNMADEKMKMLESVVQRYKEKK